MSDWIVTRPGLLGGKPCIAGTRISVEHILEVSATGASVVDILAAYPQLSAEGVRAAFDYAARALRNS